MTAQKKKRTGKKRVMEPLAPLANAQVVVPAPMKASPWALLGLAAGLIIMIWRLGK